MQQMKQSAVVFFLRSTEFLFRHAFQVNYVEQLYFIPCVLELSFQAALHVHELTQIHSITAPSLTLHF